MSATCPGCGVAVVPGYVRCPKCHAPLASGSRRIPMASGGTALPEATTERGFPLVPALVGAILVVVVGIVIATRGGDDKAKPEAPPEAVTEEATVEEVPSGPANDPLVVDDPGPTGPAAPDANAVVAEVERDLKRQKLWMSASVAGDRIELRGSSCADPALSSTVTAAATRLRAAGVTKLRCLAQAGAVQLERDL